MELTIFESDPFKVFGELVGQQLDVRVRYRGREIHATMGPPPTITLPNIEGARKEVVEVLFGFCLHEAGHLRFSNFKVIAEEIKDYLTKDLHNMIEDEWMEKALERDFPGGRDMLAYSYHNSHEMIVEGQPMLLPDLSNPCLVFRDDDNEGVLTPDLPNDVHERLAKYMQEAIDEAMRSEGLNPEDGQARDKFIRERKFDPKDTSRYLLVAKRMEIERVMRLWFFESRGYDLPLHDWPTHPWREVFRRHTFPRAKNTKAALEQARAILDDLGLTPILPADNRPVDQAKDLMEKAEKASEEARRAWREVHDLQREIREEIERRCDDNPMNEKLDEAENKEAEARTERDEAAAEVRKAREKLREAREKEKEARQNAVADRKRERELRRELKNAEDEDKDRIQQALDAVTERLKEREERLKEREAKTEELKKEVEGLQEDSLKKKMEYAEVKGKTEMVRSDYKESVKRIREDVNGENAKELKRLTRIAENADATAEDLLERANVVLKRIKSLDEKSEQQIAPGAVEYVLGTTFQEVRDEGIEGIPDDTPFVNDHNNIGNKDVIYIGDMNVRKYIPFDRSFDEIARVPESAEGVARYAEDKALYQRIIDETTDKLSRLYSPELLRVVLNQEEGRLDPRYAYKVGMAMRGVDVDITAIRKNVEPLPDPKVAVQLLIDCSGSMNTNVASNGQSLLKLAQASACCLSEVMTNLGIPHEVLGHTTAPQRMDLVNHTDEDLPHFSRFIPFEGYVFKSFEDEGAAKAVYSHVPYNDNLDGEALLWAAQRLAARSEKTKLCIVLSDGVPSAAFSSPTELQRHLRETVRFIEDQEENGFYLHGLGIGSEAVKYFYKNHSTLTTVEDLPVAVLGLIEHVLCDLVGSLG